MGIKLAPATQFFTGDEEQLIRQLADEAVSTVASLRAHTVIILKATRLCNLRCTYCNSWREGPGNVMPLEVLAKAIRDVIRAQGFAGWISCGTGAR